jgi:predicted nucleic acid-binding protein
MSSTTEVCEDASLAVKVAVTEPDSDKADAMFDKWANAGQQLVAPAFFEVETDSILRQKVVLRRELTSEQADAAFAKLQALPTQQVSMSEQRQRAWRISTEFSFTTVYDAN